MRTGEKAKVDPNFTGLNNWVEGEVIDIRRNPFVGMEVAIKDNSGKIFFGPETYFKPITKQQACSR
jgi:hypothetical protein